jgi:hypothetical protein
MITRFLLLSAALCATATGCYSGITAVETSTGNEPGLRYFLPTPYLIVEELENNQWDARIELLVDRSREFTVQPYAVLAKSTADVEFHPDGTLKKFTLDQDTTEVPEAVVSALKELQLKRLEIEKDVLEKKAEKAKKDSGGDAGRPVNRAGGRSVRIFKIAGEKLVPTNGATAEVLLTQSAGPVDSDPAANVLRIDIQGDVVLIRPPESKPPFGQPDVNAAKFFDAAGNAVEGIDVQFQGGDAPALKVNLQSLREKRVATVAVGTFAGEIPQ